MGAGTQTGAQVTKAVAIGLLSAALGWMLLNFAGVEAGIRISRWP